MVSERNTDIQWWRRRRRRNYPQHACINNIYMMMMIWCSNSNNTNNCHKIVMKQSVQQAWCLLMIVTLPKSPPFCQYFLLIRHDPSIRMYCIINLHFFTQIIFINNNFTKIYFLYLKLVLISIVIIGLDTTST